MPENPLDAEVLAQLRTAQKNEITEHHIYLKLSKTMKNSENQEVLKRIAQEELGHYNFWMKYTKSEVKPSRFKLFFYFWVSRLLGLTFGIKLMENGEARAQIDYQKITPLLPEAQQIVDEEDAHEKALINMIKEEYLNYMGSVVLGLNDALVELTGALAGLTFALQNSRLIALAGLITGIAASFSMAASEYLSTKTEGGEAYALKSSVYTGITYIITVLLLILPYLLLSNYFLSLGVTLAVAVLIIFLFNFYISVAKDYDFKKRFLEMLLISLGVAALSFGIGYIIRIFLGVNV